MSGAVLRVHVGRQVVVFPVNDHSLSRAALPHRWANFLRLSAEVEGISISVGDGTSESAGVGDCLSTSYSSWQAEIMKGGVSDSDLSGRFLQSALQVRGGLEEGGD